MGEAEALVRSEEERERVGGSAEAVGAGEVVEEEEEGGGGVARGGSGGEGRGARGAVAVGSSFNGGGRWGFLGGSWRSLSRSLEGSKGDLGLELSVDDLPVALSERDRSSLFGCAPASGGELVEAAANDEVDGEGIAPASSAHRAALGLLGLLAIASPSKECMATGRAPRARSSRGEREEEGLGEVEEGKGMPDEDGVLLSVEKPDVGAMRGEREEVLMGGGGEGRAGGGGEVSRTERAGGGG